MENSTLNSTFTHVVEKNYLDSSNIINQQQLEIASLKQQIATLQAQLQAPALVAPTPYNSDTNSIKLMRDFFRAQKPDGINSTDVLLTLGLMLFKADDHNVEITQPKLADYMACNHQTVARSKDKLIKDEYKWLSAKSLAGYPTKLTVNPEHLPLAAGALKKPTVQAKKIAAAYTDSIKKHFAYTKTYGSKKTKYGYTQFSPEWTAKQERWAQNMLEIYKDKANSGLYKDAADYTIRLLTFVRLSPTYVSEFKNGLYNIFKNKKAIEKAFEADTLAKSLSQQQPIVEPAPLEALEFTEGEES
jgi:hypothetical protein